MNVFVITFTEGDWDLVGSVYLTEELAWDTIYQAVKHDPSFIVEEGEELTVDLVKGCGLFAVEETKLKGFGDKTYDLTLTVTNCDDCGEGAAVELTGPNGEDLFSVAEGEPEDMTLGRNLGDYLSVEDLVQHGYNLALEGYTLNIESKEKDSE